MPNWSPYNYAFNNPIKFIDPDGRAPEDWIPGIDKNQGITYNKNESGEITWTNAPENFQKVGNEMLKTAVGKDALDKAIASDIKINVEFSDTSIIENNEVTLGLNTPVPHPSGKLNESFITIYEGSFNELYSKHGEGWEKLNPSGETTHSGNLSIYQNMAGTLSYEFVHSLDKGSSSYLSPNKSRDEIEKSPRKISEMFYFQMTNKK